MLWPLSVIPQGACRWTGSCPVGVAWGVGVLVCGLVAPPLRVVCPGGGGGCSGAGVAAFKGGDPGFKVAEPAGQLLEASGLSAGVPGPVTACQGWPG